MDKTTWNPGTEPFFSDEQDVRKKTLRNIRQCVIILAMLALTTILNVALERIIQPSSLVFVYLVPTIAAAVYFGTWASVIAFTCGFLIFDFGFVEPYYSLHISKPQDIYNVTVYFSIAALITYLIHLVRRQNAFLKYRLDRFSVIEDMSRDFLLLAPVEKQVSDQNLLEPLRPRALSQLGQLALKYVKLILNVPAVVYFREADGSLKIWAKSSLDLQITEKENIAATWTRNNGEVSGSGTHTNPDTPFFFIPMASCEDIIGVLGISYDSRDLFPEQRRFLGTISNLTTIAALRWLNSEA
jgi:two-component system sensor histidine kinase KdpD